ncbi:Gfo/Idh/MocA family protein [Dactylosporangium matsuzakiense]|uniref:Oxidoreductase n=1 Tax=Dactylosporangium matsuzakiense TaxID=53360 RepID=A0A9W6NSJ6_9ACTN|nr:Gfo/Idh/MocA family oxidoreductase [Dactylosporangium matsuzakiense]UWZ41221.1 Gfo/Idh/MocA family oxidoreductase [Dactylosporangium matsuzakiense]GLL07709.1 oxidoreductase [Dactylosporangium matsuzakiense]
MDGRIRFGVLGCSSVARRRTMPAIAACPEATLSVVASRDPEKAKAFAAEFGCAAAGYDELLEHDDVDAVYLPLPTALHGPWGAKVLAAGKHLLVEKPAATSADETRELVRAATGADRLLRENFTFLHHPQHARVAQLVADGRIGEPRTFTGEFCFPPLPDGDIRYVPQLGGGALLDAGVYPLRAAQLLLGDDLRVVGGALRMDPQRGVDVAGQALLVSAGGVFASAQFGFQHAYGSRYTLWGSAGRIVVDRAFTPQATWPPVLRIERQDHVEELTLPPAHQFLGAVASFAAAALAGRTARHPAEQAGLASMVRTAELVDAVRHAAV